MDTKKQLLRELMRLEKENPTKKITTPDDAYYPLMKWSKKKQEHFIVMSLDSASHIIKTKAITIGTVNRTLVSPREVFIEAMKNNAVSVILAHNHPSGNLEPSGDDKKLFSKMQEACKIMSINLLDFIIFGETGYYSFTGQNLI